MICVSYTEMEDHPKENMNPEGLKVLASQERNYRMRSTQSLEPELEQHKY